MVFSHVATASTWLAGIRHFPEDGGVGNTEHHREGVKGAAAAVSSKGPLGCRASGGTGYFQPPGLGTYRQNIICNLPQLRRQKNVSRSLNWALGFMQLAICSLVKHSLRLFLEYLGFP